MARPLLAHDGRGPLGIVGELMRLVRVDADRDPHLRPERVEAPRLRGFLRVARFENHHRALEPGVPGARDDGVEIRRERLVGEVAMAVDHDRLE